MAILYNFDLYSQTGHGSEVTIRDEKYILKSADPISEYIGSHIYNMVGISAQTTLLGYYREQLVVACKDVSSSNENFVSFEDLTKTSGNDLKKTTDAIRTHPMVTDPEKTLNLFWSLFIIDALIGNDKRTNSDWGFMSDRKSGQMLSTAPVRNNTACLKECEVLSAFELNQKRLNPFQYISSHSNMDCTSAARQIIPYINIERIQNLIDDIFEIGLITDSQRIISGQVLKARYKILHAA